MSWTLDGKDEADAIREISTIFDRAAAILAAAILENRLEGALRRALRDHRKNANTTVHGLMFDGMGPLKTFSAKINLGLMIGLYGSGAWNDLDSVWLLRNHFAHESGMRDFSVAKARSRSMNLKGFERHVFPKGTQKRKRRVISTQRCSKTNFLSNWRTGDDATCCASASICWL